MVEHRITSGWKNHSESTTAATHFKMKSILLDKIAEIIFFKNLYMQIQMLNIDNLSVSLNWQFLQIVYIALDCNGRCSVVWTLLLGPVIGVALELLVLVIVWVID